MGFGQSVKGDTKQIRRKGGDGDMLQAIHHQTVINLITEDDQLMLSGHLDNLFQHFPGIECPGRIVRVDHNNRLGLIRNFSADIIQIWIPVGLLVTDIMNHISAGQCGTCSPQRIVRCRNQDLIPVVQQRLHGNADQFTDSVAGVDILTSHVGQILLFAVGQNRLSRLRQSL